MKKSAFLQVCLVSLWPARKSQATGGDWLRIQPFLSHSWQLFHLLPCMSWAFRNGSEEPRAGLGNLGVGFKSRIHGKRHPMWFYPLSSLWFL